SSAAGEDAGAASFAGQHLTELGVEGADAVVAAVERCRASLGDSRQYREARGVAAGAMAVVVQRMVAARAAGGAFTADPRPGERWTRAIGDEFWADATSPYYFSAMGRHIDERVGKDLSRLRGLPVEYDRPGLRLHGGRAYWSEEGAYETVRLAPKSMRTE